MQYSAFIYLRIARCFFGLILLALFFSSLSAQSIDHTDGYILRGRVIEAGSTQPVSDVVMRMIEAGNRAVTDAEGRFALEHLNAGSHTLVISHSNYLELHITLQIPAKSDLEIEIQPVPRYHETVTVTATPWAVDQADVAQSADVLDTAEVRVRSGLSVGDAVGSLPGVRSISTGESSGTPMIRGQTNERVRVLDNGFPHDYYQFSRRHMPNIETYDSNSIEIIRGPASVLYGTQAMGGLTNLVSEQLPTAAKDEHVIRGEGLLGYGSNNALKIGHAQIEGAKGGFGGRLSWTQRAAGNTSTPEGDLPNTGYDQHASLLEIGYQSPHGFRLQGRFRYWENKLGFYIPSQPDFRLNLRNDVGQIESITPSQWGELHFSYNVSKNARRAFSLGYAQGAKVDLGLLTQMFRISLQHKPTGPFRGWLQVEYNRQKNESFGPVTLLPHYRNRTWAAAIFEEIRLIQSGGLDRFVLNVGLRYDNRSLEVPANPGNGILGDFHKSYAPPTGSVGAVYRFNRALSAGLSYIRGWRNPSEYELFADGPHDGALLYEKGNPALKEEKDRNTEFTLRLEDKRVRGFLALFYDRYDNYIYQRLTGEIQDELPIGIFAQSDAIVKGFEGQLAFDATQWFTLNFSGDALQSRNLATGTHLPFAPPDRAILSAHFYNPSSIEWINPYVEIKCTLTGKGKISGIDEPFPLNTGGYVLFDLGAGVQRRFEKGILAFDLWISNLANRSYRDFLDTYKLYALSPGRNMRATLRFLF
jgi:outer membrane receptor protein involved in Fe transport